jgi:hypothetical protein
MQAIITFKQRHKRTKAVVCMYNINIIIMKHNCSKVSPQKTLEAYIIVSVYK